MLFQKLLSPPPLFFQSLKLAFHLVQAFPTRISNQSHQPTSNYWALCFYFSFKPVSRLAIPRKVLTAFFLFALDSKLTTIQELNSSKSSFVASSALLFSSVPFPFLFCLLQSIGPELDRHFHL